MSKQEVPKQETPKHSEKKLKLNFSFQNIIIIILLLSYILIFYLYNLDIDQYEDIFNKCKEIVENPQQMCGSYCNYLMKGDSLQSFKTETNISDMFVQNNDDK